jgi:translation initiation factor 2B subunit (eIF-2B alpha/beta/delta family)
VFLRVHAQYLTKAAQSSASTLASGGPAATSLAVLAKNVAGDLDRLSHSGSDRTQQRRLAAALTRAATRAAKLGQRA